MRITLLLSSTFKDSKLQTSRAETERKSLFYGYSNEFANKP